MDFLSPVLPGRRGIERNDCGDGLWRRKTSDGGRWCFAGEVARTLPIVLACREIGSLVRVVKAITNPHRGCRTL